jgi:hypothetical protein
MKYIKLYEQINNKELKILLDIDGVMVVEKPWKMPKILDDGFLEFTKESVDILNFLILKYDPEIILTTSHKHKYDINKWEEIFKTRGVNLKNNKLSRLNTDTIKIGRLKEIQKWCNDNPNENYIILDNDKSLYNLPENIKDNMIITNSFTGIKKHLLEDILNIINHI